MNVGALPGWCLWEDVVLEKSKPSICRSTSPHGAERASICSNENSEKQDTNLLWEHVM